MKMELNQVSPNVIVLRVSYQAIVNYSYLVVDPIYKQSVIIDPAWQMDIIEDAIYESNTRLSGILLTHSHPDHVHLAKPLANKYSCPIWMSKEEIQMSGYHADQLVSLTDAPVSIGGITFHPIFTPGHTSGSTCYLIDKALFTGDVLFAEGCGICPSVAAAHSMWQSLEHLKLSIEPDVRIFPGHSYGKPPGRLFSKVLKENMYLHFDCKESFAAFRLRSRKNILKMRSFY